MSARYFKWEVGIEMAYGKLPHGQTGPFLGSTATHLTVGNSGDPSLVEITETEFEIWWHKLFLYER